MDFKKAYEQISHIQDIAYDEWKVKHRAFLDYADSFPYGFGTITKREADEMGELDSEAEFLNELIDKLGEAMELIEGWCDL